MGIHGKNGNILLAGSTAVANLTNWSLTRTNETAETSSMGDEWGQSITGLTDFTVAAEGKSKKGLDTVALLGSLQAATELVTADGASEYSGGVIVSGITETSPVDSEITISYTFDGNDAAGLQFAASGTAGSGAVDPIHGKHMSASIDVLPISADVLFTDITNWTMTMTVPLSDTTVAHATNCGRTKIAGIKTATATVTVLTPSAVLPIVEGESGLLKLNRSGTLSDGYYEGTAIFTGAEQGVDTTGAETTTISFIFTGAVTLEVA